jgi:OTU domain-containing protein 6
MEETLEQAQARHRKEQRDLQSRITQKKKNATKKTRKSVNDECAELERQLKERQEEEIRRLADPDGHVTDAEDGEVPRQEEPGPEHKPDPPTNDELSSRLESTTLSEPQPQKKQQPTPSAEGANGGAKKRNRQKERLARRAAEIEAAAAAAAEEASTMTDHRGTEKSRMEPVFASNRLVEREVAPDGHCLFAAFADGLKANGIEPSQALVQTDEKAKVLPYKVVRRVAAGYMAAHGDEFAGFLEEPLEEYVAKIRDTAEWGGQLELTALANAYGVEVRVVQDGRTEVIAPTEAVAGEKKVVWLAYYRHGYGLGEHYNSLRPKEKDTA